MSTCISSHGEYSSHQLDATFTCTLCGVLDEDALSAELVRLNAELADAKNELKATQNARLLSVVFGHHKGAPKPFVLQRRNGHAVVAVGAEFPDGAVALRLADDGGWTTASEGGAEHFCDDSTEIVWLSDELESLAEMELQRDRAVAELAEARRELDARDRYQEALAIGLSDYEAREEGWPTAAAPSSSDGDSQEIAERDFYHEVADILAAKVALLAGVDIGEHSNANNPWQNAIDAADRMIAATAPSSSDGAGLTGCPNCDGLDGTHTLRSCLAMADVERYRSFVAPGFDCPECLVDTGDSAHMVSCSIGRRLGCATRTDGAGQTDEAEYLLPIITDRGFKWMPAINGTHHTRIVAYESSNASGPHIWVKASDEGVGESQSAHLPLDAAVQFAEQIQYLAANHYQRATASVSAPAEDDEPIDLDDLKRRAEALAPGVTDQLHNLLGCTWGHTIAIKGHSDDECPNKADEVVVLHQDGIENAFKLCAGHAELVKEETTPREAAASVSAPVDALPSSSDGAGQTDESERSGIHTWGYAACRHPECLRAKAELTASVSAPAEEKA